MKKLGFGMLLFLTVSAFAQESDPLGTVNWLKGKCLTEESDRYMASLSLELSKLSPKEEEALLKLWVVEAVDSKNQAYGISQMDLCTSLDADLDFEVKESGFQFGPDDVLAEARPGDRILHVLLREEKDKVFYKEFGWMISEIIPFSYVCSENKAGEKPSDVLVCEKFQLGGTWDVSAECDGIRSALKSREKELGCLSS